MAYAIIVKKIVQIKRKLIIDNKTLKRGNLTGQS